MKYKITMRKSYSEIEFIFNTLLDAAYFMREALEHTKEDISFIVEAIKEEENTESTIEEGCNTDEE